MINDLSIIDLGRKVEVQNDLIVEQNELLKELIATLKGGVANVN